MLDIVGRDLPENSPARSVMADAKQEAVQINRILQRFLETARPRPPPVAGLPILQPPRNTPSVLHGRGDYQAHLGRAGREDASAVRVQHPIPTRSIRSC